MFAVEGAEITFGGSERTFLIFFLTTLPLVKYFLINILELRAHLGFYIRDISSRGTAYRFSVFNNNELPNFFVYNSVNKFSVVSIFYL